MPSIHISRPGKFKSAEGADIEITPAILSEVNQTYDASKFEAQLVIGHPHMEAPSFGGIRSLSFGGDGLEAEAEPTEDARDLVSKRHFKSVSASFYTPTAPNNPTPGKWHLRHVGLLGAVPPAVKGLRALSFAEAEEGVVTFGDLPGYAGLDIARMFRRLREWFIDKEGLEAADRVLPSWDVDGIQATSQRAVDMPDTDDEISGGTPALSFAEPGNAATLSPTPEINPMTKTVEQLQTELDASNQALQAMRDADAARATADRATAATARHAAHASFAEGLVTAAKWPGNAKDALVSALDVLATPGETSGVVSFGEGDAAKPLVTVLQEHLQELPSSVSFGEFARKEAGGQGALSNKQIADRAAAYRDRRSAAGQAISLSEAIDAVNNGTDK